MISAIDARNATNTRLTEIATDFINNEIVPAMRKSIQEGEFFVVVDLDKIPSQNIEAVGDTVVSILKQHGVDRVKWSFVKKGPIYTAYVYINWECRFNLKVWFQKKFKGLSKKHDIALSMMNLQ